MKLNVTPNQKTGLIIGAVLLTSALVYLTYTSFKKKKEVVLEEVSNSESKQSFDAGATNIEDYSAIKLSSLSDILKRIKNDKK